MVRARAWILAVGLAAALVGGANGLADLPPGGVRTEVPIREVDLSSGTRRYTIPITVGATAIKAGLDSGSTGLRVLPNVLAAADAATDGGEVTYSYDSGVKLDGIIGHGAISIGELSGRSPLQLVHFVGCVAAKPNCPALRVPLAQYGIQGDGLPGEGFKAIIGVNMSDDAAPNPLERIGAKRWIIELPRPGRPAEGRLILNPTEAETSGYMMVQLDPSFSGQHGGLHDAAPGCLLNLQTKQRICGPTLMDTGAPGINLVGPSRQTIWPNETPAQIVFSDGKRVLGSDFVVGHREQASHFASEARPQARSPRLFVGIMPYFAFSVLYDPGQGMIGLKPRG